MLPGVTQWGPSSSEVGLTTQDTYEIQANVSYSMGRHSMQFGANIQRVHVTADGGAFDNGAFEWGSVRDFLEDRPLDAFTSVVPGSTSVRFYRQNVFGFFVRDDWTVTPNLTLNLGLRYEPYTGPTETEGRTVTVNDWRTATGVEAGVAPWKQNSLDNFSPRVGLAWDVRGDSKTIVRSGFGLFYQPLLTSYYSSLSDKTPPFGGVIRNRPTGGNFATARTDLIRLSAGQLLPDVYA